MNPQSVLLLVVILVMAAFAIRRMIKNRKNGCAGCGYDCSTCPENSRKKK